MFDITSSKLLLLGIVALLVIGPKDLPALLRTVGKYVGIIKRQAAEFRAQFEEAMRDSELQQLKKDVEGIQRETEQVMREAEHSVDKEVAEARQSVDGLLEEPKPPPAASESAPAHDADGPPPAKIDATDAAPALNGASPSVPEPVAPAYPTDSAAAGESRGEAARAPEKSGV